MTVRVDEGEFIEDGIYLVFQPAERPRTFWIGTLVRTSEGLVLRLWRRNCAHGAGDGGGNGRSGKGALVQMR